MRNLRRFLIPIVAIWVMAGGLVWWSRSARTTPETIEAYVKAHPLDKVAGGERAQVIDRVADQLNKLDFEQRQQLRKTHMDRDLFDQMTPEERTRFLDRTLPEGFKQLMIALNKMKPEQRKKIVQRALDDLEKDNPEMNKRLDDEQAKKMLSQGVSSFYENASADVKLDFAPVLEQIQHSTQNFR